MDIVHSLPNLSVDAGGPPRSVSQLCAALSNSIKNVSLLTCPIGDGEEVPLDPKIRLLHGKSGGSFLSKFSPQLSDQDFKSAIHIREKSIIHQHGIWLGTSHAASRFAHKENLPLIIAPRGMLEPWAINNSKWKKKLAWLLYQRRDLERATAFHATAHSEAESIRRLGFKQPIAIIPNGIMLPELPEQRLGHQNPSVKTALFLSRIHPKKGLPILLDAWKKVAPPDWRLVIAGNDDGGHVPKLVEQIDRLGLADRVEIVGALFGAEKEQAYLNADLFVLPSYSENFGIVIAEALSFQVPVLTTKGCPWQELETERCGWWVDPNPVGLEQGLREAFAAAPNELLAIGQRGRSLVEAKYQWPAIADQMVLFYDWILNGGIKPDFVV
jgi:glycosyltransferase involved in cell wall biosynthesis